MLVMKERRLFYYIYNINIATILCRQPIISCWVPNNG